MVSVCSADLGFEIRGWDFEEVGERRVYFVVIRVWREVY
jgi:hypothetical protein